MLQTKYFAKPCMGHLKNIYILLDFVLYVSTFCLYTFPDLCSFKQTSATKKKKKYMLNVKENPFQTSFLQWCFSPTMHNERREFNQLNGPNPMHVVLIYNIVVFSRCFKQNSTPKMHGALEKYICWISHYVLPF